MGSGDRSHLSDTLDALECFDHTKDSSFAANVKQAEKIMNHDKTSWTDPCAITSNSKLKTRLLEDRDLLLQTRWALHITQK